MKLRKWGKEKLDNGITRRNPSALASPVLDGNWRFCMDYRVLNNLTIKDKFSIPVVEELLNELHVDVYFLKIDLRSAYLQVRMHA